jgi:hypothetical protein
MSMKLVGWALLLISATNVVGCSSKSEDTPATPPAHLQQKPGLPERPTQFPSLVALPDQKEVIKSRLSLPVYSDIFADIQTKAGQAYVERSDATVWDSSHEKNGEIAANAAFLAWINDDPTMGEKAKSFLEKLPTDYNSNQTIDINIRMPHVLVGHSNALDFLQATPWANESLVRETETKLLSITSDFYDAYVENDVQRTLFLGVSQNNHPLRTAASIAYIALAYPDHPKAETWANWAFSELAYLWGTNGKYVQEDGGVSEGPFYHGFGFTPSLALFLAWNNRTSSAHVLHHDCRNRQSTEPWADHGCVEGTELIIDHPLQTWKRFQLSTEWSMALRLPSGDRPPMEDAYFNPFTGAAIVAHTTGNKDLTWDWLNQVDRKPATTGGLDLMVQHLVQIAPEEITNVPEPTWTSKILPVAGQAVFRSGWDPNARWGMVTAEHGPARQTLHDHVDGTSFTMAAYGEYLLIDPGYYKPNSLNNARTSGFGSHNVVLIDGEQPPDKGLLDNFGDTDTFLTHPYLDNRLGIVEASLPLPTSTVFRDVLYIDNRYFVIADHVTTTQTSPRMYTWRMHGNAGYEAGGEFSLGSSMAEWRRASAGVQVFLASTSPGLTLTEPPFVNLEAPHVHEFDRSRAVGHHKVVDGMVQALAPGFLAVLAPYQVGAQAGTESSPLAVEALTMPEGVSAFSVSRLGGQEIVVLRSKDAPQLLKINDNFTIESDALVTVVSRTGTMAVVIHGSFVNVNGQPRNFSHTETDLSVSPFLRYVVGVHLRPEVSIKAKIVAPTP